ncbi:hypothetical protein GCM10010517_03490 [Streptosporangium fragile]|uniref:AraC family transcriptional regulator n=1 Tax=Streptosporangium fragile TaxID=46186 RepID=A0ABP6I6E5_9ACTN
MSGLGHLAKVYHSIHVAPVQEEHIVVAWRPAGRRADRVRVREHTCWCRKPSYELCTASGLAFIRRSCRDGGLLHESDWLRVRDAEQLWLWIISGRAR